MTRPAVARPAATIVLLRSDGRIFFVKRHSKSAFMANAHVFPGGRVDEGDVAPDVLDRLGALEAGVVERFAEIGSEEMIRAHYVAAIRETFEEAGVLLARTEDGAMLDVDGESERRRFGRWRDRLNAKDVSFGELLAAENLTLASDSLTYFAHWITPKVEGRRFDARFFIARSPEHQREAHDEIETTASCWLTAREALALYNDGGFGLAPPTWRILEDLAGLETCQEVLAWANRMSLVPTHDPHIAQCDGRLVLALPGDVLHPRVKGRDINRIVLRDGVWSHPDRQTPNEE